MNDIEFEQVALQIKKHTGIYFPPSKKYFVESKIDRRLREIGKLKSINSAMAYMDYISLASDKKELEEFFKMVTINETFFFRSPQQFDTLTHHIIPELIDKKLVSGSPLRIWSGASSSGDEIYTLAIMIRELLLPKYPNGEFILDGTDIDVGILNKARKGEYRNYAIRNVPLGILNKYFTKQSELYHLNKSIVSQVQFRKLNLNNSSDISMMRGRDIVLLANVLIYFDLETKKKVVNDLYNVIAKGGYLLVGYSESLHGVEHKFETIRINKTIVYKKN